MVRIVIKGGVWKNTEDEILKAAVMKYGKNQWARISSLLVRKSSKQCKQRWYEWLDPSIKKTEWTREEEEKLVHLAKIMPCQWRTIAPIIGRTAAQCLEHYERLLDGAREKDETYDPASDPRRLRPGEIDPNPEGKPARPDPVDMDEDEKEMLNEARARLANTKGKKAKRKARERQLEEARRLAALQKKRELKAAGIDIRRGPKRRRRTWIDYGEEIPFERRPQAGFYDVTEERKTAYEAKNDPKFLKMNLKQLDGEQRDAVEERERKKDKRRQALARKANLPQQLVKINKMNNPDEIRRRAALILPAPQVSDRELEDVAKISSASLAVTKDLMGGSAATKALLASYSATPNRVQNQASVARTPQSRDTILLETQNLIALTNSQTPLAGGENAILNPSDFSGATPKRRVAATPNVLATPGGGATPMRTPGGGATPRSVRTAGGSVRAGGGTPSMPMTPMRDEMGINTQQGMTAEQALHAGSARAEKRRRMALRGSVRQGLQNLPAALNEYAVVMPEIPKEPIATKKKIDVEEDAEDMLERLEREHQRQLDAENKRRPQTVQRGLPRPQVVNFLMREQADKVKSLLAQEVVSMLKHDLVAYPLIPEDGSKTKKPKKEEVFLDQFTPEELKRANELVAEELDDGVGVPRGEVVDTFWHEVNEDVLFLPSQKSYGMLSTVEEPEQLEALKQHFNLLKQHAIAQEAKTDKALPRATIPIQGYMLRKRKLAEAMAELNSELSDGETDLLSFQGLQTAENVAIPNRLMELQRLVQTNSKKESELQERYSQLIEQRKALRDILNA
eukprot:gb/GEZN01002010.1/.p1 GENE.gb/GEZN01002010.1/~~gb/GEZN01002010.1/.p1  ORF type:complete len:798 (+),score=178.29 gb/GEZN01002010.1/:59-2452(+)